MVFVSGSAARHDMALAMAPAHTIACVAVNPRCLLQNRASCNDLLRDPSLLHLQAKKKRPMMKSMKPQSPAWLQSVPFLPLYASGTAVDTGSFVNDSLDSSPDASVATRYWKWKDYTIRYQVAGDTGPALVLIHGFGANCDHWRKNIPALAKNHRVFAIDLLGYGYSDKPDPTVGPPNSIYNFENWASQLCAFCSEIVNDKVFLICNSVGGVVGLQTAICDSDLVKGLVLLNISLRMLHIKKQQWYVQPFVKAFQNVLRNTDLGKSFFKAVATPASVKKILCECYHDDSAVTDELVEKILSPGLQPGAVDVFLDFICYSGGPLPEELLPDIKCPVLIGWGERDPWEPIELGRAYGAYSCVEEFVVLPNVGHCPQDEAPHLINPLIESFVSRHLKSS